MFFDWWKNALWVNGSGSGSEPAGSGTQFFGPVAALITVCVFDRKVNKQNSCCHGVYLNFVLFMTTLTRHVPCNQTLFSTLEKRIFMAENLENFFIFLAVEFYVGPLRGSQLPTWNSRLTVYCAQWYWIELWLTSVTSHTWPPSLKQAPPRIISLK